jgi:hypothetical protein
MKDLVMNVVGLVIISLMLSCAAITAGVALGSCAYVSFKIIQFIFGV